MDVVTDDSVLVAI